MPRLANAPLRAKLLGAFGIVLTVLVLLSSAAYRTTSVNQEATAAVIDTFQVIRTANALLADLVDMETGYRGYLIAGDDAFLEPYWRGSAKFDQEIADLQALTADNPAQVARWRSIEAQVNEWRQRVTEPGIALRREIRDGARPADDLGHWVGSGEGRRRFATIRATFGEALAVEEELLGQRQAEAAAASERLQVVLIVGTIVAVGLAVILALLLTADIVGPITRLARTAEVIAAGDLDRRIGLDRGDEIGVAGAAFDRMAEQLQATIVRSRAILDTAAEGIVGLDRTGRVVFANPAAARMAGMDERAMIERSAVPWIEPASAPHPDPSPSQRDGQGRGSPADGAPEDAAPKRPPPIRAALDFGVVEHGAGDLLRGDGGRLPIEYACAPIRDASGVVGAVLTFRDVTERRAAERALEERAGELARSNADLEQFAYVASHDLQEPLRAVVSYLQLLERRYGGQLDERAEKYIGYAVDGGRRMQTLISDLLTFSRVGRRDMAREPVDLEAVLDRVQSSLRVAIEESGAAISHDPLPTVHGDSTQLAQVFQNLLANAIKFRGAAPPRIHVGAERRDGAWLFSVRDNGIGIAPEYRERVFVLFQRLHGRDEYGGTGIGLAVCKKIVERHGGALWVDVTTGGGSTFWFTIPDAGEATP